MKSKYKGVYKATNGKWYYATRIKQEDGTYKSVKSKQYDTPIEAYQSLLNIKNGITKDAKKQIDQKTSHPTKSVSFIQCYQEWIDAYSVKSKSTSAHCTKNICETKLLPQFKDASINYLCESRVLVDMMQYLKDLPVSNTMRNKVIQFYTQICERAFYNGYITQNEYGMVKLSLVQFNKNSNVKESSQKKREKYFYTKEEFEQFISVITNETDHLIFTMLFYGGFRIGELLALTPNDINVEDNSISVSKAFNMLKETTTPKTLQSNRIVYLPSKVIRELIGYISSNSIDAHTRVFPMCRIVINNKCKLYAQESNLEDISPHCFRHSYVSYVISLTKDKGIPFKFLSSQTGDNVNTIMEVYSHIYKTDAKEIMSVIENA